MSPPKRVPCRSTDEKEHITFNISYDKFRECFGSFDEIKFAKNALRSRVDVKYEVADNMVHSIKKITEDS